jgi:polyisoprenoid-binding protein YceI
MGMSSKVWTIHAARSSLRFRVSYFQIGAITGAFLRFDGEVIADETFTEVRATVAIEADSIETFDKRRNAKLRSTAFFDAVEYPTIIFVVADGCKTSNGIREVTGELTIQGRRLPVTLVVSYAELGRNRKPPVARFRLFGTVSRSEAGLGQAEEEIGDEVRLDAEIVLKPQEKTKSRSFLSPPSP